MNERQIKVQLTAEDMQKLNKDGGLTVKSEDKFVTILSIDSKDGTLDMCSFKDTQDGLKPVTIITKFDSLNGQHFFNTIRFGSKTFDNRDIQEVYTEALTNAKDMRIYKNQEEEIVPIDIGDLSEEFADIVMETIEEIRKKEDAEILIEIDGEIYHLDGNLADEDRDIEKENAERTEENGDDDEDASEDDDQSETSEDDDDFSGSTDW